MKIKSRQIKTKNPAPVIAMDVNPKNTMLAISQQGEHKTDPILSLIDLTSLKEIEVIERYDLNSIPSVAFCFVKDILLYSKNDYYVEIFDLNKLKLINSIGCDRNKKINCSKNSNKVILSGAVLEVWELENVSKIWQDDKYRAFENFGQINSENLNISWNSEIIYRGQFITQPAAACFFEEDNKILYAGVNEPKVFLYDFKEMKPGILLNDGAFQCYEMKLSHDNKYLSMSTSIPAGAFVWNLETKERAIPGIANEKHNSSSAIEFHPKKNIIALGSLAGSLTIVDIDQEKILFSESIHQSKISQVFFINGGAQIITSSMNGEILITDISISGINNTKELN